MINLFEQDKSSELKKRETNLKLYFYHRLTSTQENDNNLQQKINQWMNLGHYEYLRSGDLTANSIREIINQRFAKHKRHLDSSPETFEKTFPRQCAQNIFELVMADLISRERDLVEKSTPPDLVFGEFFIECATSITSQIDRWDALLPKFDEVFDIFTLLYKKSGDTNQWFFTASISVSYQNLSNDDRTFLEGRLLCLFHDQSATLDSLVDLVFIFRYASLYFEELIPDQVLESLARIEFPLKSISDQYHDFEFLTKRLALSICDKLKKPYFIQGRPGIIAVSLSMASCGFGLDDHNTKKFIEYLSKNLFHIFRSVVEKKSADVRLAIESGQKNLFALVVDTCWYNWFPDVLGVWPEERKNIYYAIYNQDHTRNEQEGKIFDLLVAHSIHLPLSGLYWRNEQ